MTETLAIVLCSDILMVCGAYWILRWKPSLLNIHQAPAEPVMVSLNGHEPEEHVGRAMKICMFCDEPISKAARRCPHCTSNLPMQS